MMNKRNIEETGEGSEKVVNGVKREKETGANRYDI